jgi:site-specific recombinase XerD
MDFIDALEEFLTAGRQRGWRPGTVASYRWHLEHFQQWLVKDGGDNLAELTSHRVRRWGASIHDGWQPSTTRGAVAAARSFFRYLQKERIITEDLAAALVMPKVPDKAQRTISSSEVSRLMRACSTGLEDAKDEETDVALAVRNVALVAVLYDSMLRAAELCALKVSDVDFDRGVVRVRLGKGGKGRMAPIGPDAILSMQVWLKLRASPAVRLAPGVKSLFVSVGGSTPGRSLTVSGLRLILRRLGERAGLQGVSPHAFRRGGAVAATLRGAPSRLVQMWGGWSNIRMVELYTRTLQDDPATMEQFRRFSPLGSVGNGRGWLVALQRALAEGAPESPGKRRLRRGVVPPGRAIRWAGRSGGPAV